MLESSSVGTSRNPYIHTDNTTRTAAMAGTVRSSADDHTELLASAELASRTATCELLTVQLDDGDSGMR